MKNWYVFLCAVMVLSGCIINKPAPSAPLSASEPLPWETGATVQVGAETEASPTASASVTAVASTPPAPPPPVATATVLPTPYTPPPPPAPPHVVIRRPVGSPYLQATVETEAPKSMSVRLVNNTPFYVCVESPTLPSGEPVFKPRYGAFAQDFMPPGAGVPCAAVLAPRVMAGLAPEATLAVTRPGAYRLGFRYYTHSTSPVLIRSAQSERWSFPNVPGVTNCGRVSGTFGLHECLYKYTIGGRS